MTKKNKNPHLLSRRNFLKMIAITSGALLSLKLGGDYQYPLETVSETRLLMGTVVNITAVSSNLKTAHQAIQLCYRRMAELESVLSRFKKESEISLLNQYGEIKNAHPAFIKIMQQSLDLSIRTQGAFDISIMPLLSLYQSGKNLSANQIEKALKLTDYRKIALYEQSITFQQPGMSITLDGIAKGYIIDEGSSVLKELGFINVIVEAGGDLMALGEKNLKKPWKIGLQNPRAEIGHLIATLQLQDQALATSGDYMQAFTSDFSLHHILDPRTGNSAKELASASVIANSAALSDGLATAVMVMGKPGLELIESLPDCEAYLVTKELQVLKTSGFPQIE